MPEMHFVQSSSIEAIGYDPDSQELHVRFLKAGETYVYSNVESWIFDEFMKADSKGVFLNQRIKNIYPWSKL